MKKILTHTKQTFQILFKTGKYYKRHKGFKFYTDQIIEIQDIGQKEYILLDEFAVYCRKKYMLGEGIRYFEKWCQNAKGKSLAVLNFFRVQLYIRLHKADPSKVSTAKIRQLVDSVLLSSFGPDFNHLIFKNTPYENQISSSEIKFMDVGWENIGFIFHAASDSTYDALSKIGTSYQHSNEHLFYEKISTKYSSLQNRVPKFIDYRLGRFGVVNLLTMQKVEGLPCGISDFDNLIQLHFETLQRCPYDSTLQQILEQPFRINYNHIHLSKSFGKIHDKKYFNEILDWIDTALSESPYDVLLISEIKRLTDGMKDAKLYNSIHPEQHYTLCHGDYSLNNVLYNKNKNEYHIIDWTQSNYGPKMMDISTILRKQREYAYSFAELEDMVLKYKDEYSLTIIDQFLFYFGSILVSLMLKRGTIINEDPKLFFIPAVHKCLSLLEVKEN
ncbi:MAG TPA: phosphotransferase [Anditalea sp.]|nr:phosphotransferase [Anditalea sp.]